MSTNSFELDMLGDTLKNAVVDAQTRLADDSVMARCHEGLWSVERSGVVVDGGAGLSYAAAVACAEGLT